MSRVRSKFDGTVSPLEQINNYFERLVIEELAGRILNMDNDALIDVTCIALNELPAKYIRHEVDLLYFTGPAEMEALHARVSRAVDMAIGRVVSGRN